MTAARLAGLTLLVSILVAGISKGPPAHEDAAPPATPKPAPAPRRPWRPVRPGENAETTPDVAKSQAGPRDPGPQEAGKVSPDGKEEIAVDLPESEKKRNVGGRDGAGLCVFTSIEYAARWQNERRLIDLQARMKREPGGGYPDKVAAMIKKYGAGSPYVQYEGNDASILKAALRSGRMPCVTYNGHDCHYNGTIAHMVTLVHLSDRWACIGDNNFTKDNQYVWMTPNQFLQRWRGNQQGWCVVLLHAPPPPVPHN
jgi:hypothetical protein